MQATRLRAKCIVCQWRECPEAAQKMKMGEVRFWWRLMPTKAEKSLHASCILDKQILDLPGATVRHLKLSLSFLSKSATNESLDNKIRELLLECSDIFRTALAAVAGASSGAPG